MVSVFVSLRTRSLVRVQLEGPESPACGDGYPFPGADRAAKGGAGYVIISCADTKENVGTNTIALVASIV